MRIASRPTRIYAALSAALALALATVCVESVANCGDCPGDKTCLLEDTATTLGARQATLQFKFCNFDASKSDSYALAFSLKAPLACDADNALAPSVTSLKAQDGCVAANCVVTATLEQPIDWALLLQNGADPSALQARITGANGKDEIVQVAKGMTAAGTDSLSGDGESATKATVCTTEFGVKASRLSTRAECNQVTFCRGKASDAGCTTPISTSTLVDDVECSSDSCTGTVTLSGALPCDAASNSILVSIKVGNSAGSPYAAIATLSAASAASISAASGVSVGSQSVTIKSDATCLENALNVSVDGLKIDDFSAANGSIVVSLASALTAAQSGSSLDLTVSQCGVVSEDFTAIVTESGVDDVSTAAATTGSGSKNLGDDGSAGLTGSTSTQMENADTGLPGGLYIAIAVGALALVGFAFECLYHRRRHRHEHGTGNGAVPNSTRAV